MPIWAGDCCGTSSCIPLAWPASSTYGTRDKDVGPAEASHCGMGRCRSQNTVDTKNGDFVGTIKREPESSPRLRGEASIT
eukprot:scaffold4161_cov101-Isochrysis_galbana.AAC.11